MQAAGMEGRGKSRSPAQEVAFPNQEDPSHSCG